MESLVIALHVLAAIGITGLVLIQQGKGADMGASFGSGASQTIFGSVGSGNALTKSTAWLATVFFITSLVLALFARQQAGRGIQAESLLQNSDVVAPAVQQQPVQQAPESDLPAVSVETGDLPQAVEASAQEAVELLEQTLQEAQEQAGEQP